MRERIKWVERRQHKRYPVVPQLLVSLNPELVVVGNIVNLSLGGLEFRYIGDGGGTREASTLNISMTDGSFFFFEIPFKSVWNWASLGEYCQGSVTLRSRGVEFRGMTDAQSAELRHVIQNYTLDENTSPCRRSNI